MRIELHAVALLLIAWASSLAAQESLPKATIDGTGAGWQELTLADFQMVNGDDDTWSWKDGVIHCTGQPVGVTRSKEPVTNFELVAQWRHLKSGGNSGIFVWAAEEALKDLPKGKLPPGGIEVQVLDHGYEEQYEKTSGQKGRLVHDQRRCVSRRQIEDDAVPAGLARRPAELSHERAEQGGRRVEPLLRPRQSTAKCGCGSTARKCPAARNANRPAATCASNRKGRRSSSRTCGFAGCRRGHFGEFLRQCQCLVAAGDVLVELCIADLIEDFAICRPGRNAKLFKVVARDQRRRIQLGRGQGELRPAKVDLRPCCHRAQAATAWQ